MIVQQIRRHLSWKIFLSYLIVIVVGVSVLATAANFAAPGAFDRHIAAMGSMMGRKCRPVPIPSNQIQTMIASWTGKSRCPARIL